MKKLINNILKFSVIFIIGSMLLVIGTISLKRQVINFNIPPDKTVLVVGDSHAAFAVNDNILTNVFNFSQGGSSYFYTYLKVRKILAQNPQINIVVIGYSYGDLVKWKDKWFNGEEKIKWKMPTHLFLFDFSDFYSLFIANPYHVLIHIHLSTLKEIKEILSNSSLNNLGRFRDIKFDNLQKSKNRYLASQKSKKVEYSKYQEEYLLKIYHLTMEKNKKLILLNVPIHPILEKERRRYKEYYYSLVKQKLPKATIINHSNMDIPEICFADIEHLNAKGAKLYSKYLKEHGILSQLSNGQ